MTLKEILAERRRAQQPVSPICNNQVDERKEIHEYVIQRPTSEFYALFEGCTDF